MTCERPATRFERLREISGQIRLPGLRVEKTRSDGGIIGKTHRARVERSSLAMGSHGGCTRRCRRRVLQDGLRVGRGLGVMREAGEIRRARRRSREHGQGLAVQCQAPVRQERLFECQPRQLVAEDEPARLRFEHARG